MRQRVGFARPSAGDHQQRRRRTRIALADAMLDGAPLLGIELVEMSEGHADTQTDSRFVHKPDVEVCSYASATSALPRVDDARGSAPGCRCSVDRTFREVFRLWEEPSVASGVEQLAAAKTGRPGF